MIIEINIPDIGDAEGMTIATWCKQTGDIVEKYEILAEVDSDKALITLNAPEAGRLEIVCEAGFIKRGVLIAKIDTSFQPEPKHPNTISPNDIIGR
jgi:2-oxoglutarate dehydrogenase E2 component (dihydrolipoamide succinyltransferase)